MIQIDDKIISTDILTEKFCCDISQCKGICCVEGNAGAPLDEDEIEVLEREYDNFKEYMTGEGRAVVESEGVCVIDGDGDLTTPLVNDAECAYSFVENGITLCAIERAYKEGKCGFIKPVSCHLYPIRIAKFSNGTVGLNYHRWNVCCAARDLGCKLNIPVYKMLREPIIRRFGKEFYDALCEAEGLLAEFKDKE